EQIRTEMTWIVLTFLLVFLIMMCMISYPSLYFIRSIISPVMELSNVTKRIAGGDMSARASVGNGDDELTELAKNLNAMAEELSSTDKMKNDFISTVSHEMKTPLTAIKGWGETLLTIGSTDPDMTKRGLEVIVEESARLTGVVEDLLDLSKISNGRLTLKYEKMDVLAELDDTIFVFKDRAMREGIELSYNAPSEPAPTEGDATRIKQVFVNILDNAFKYNAQGGSVTVVATRIPPAEGTEKGVLQVQVEDTGCGISAEELPKVKKKFYKSNISVKGSGIGLAVCDEIVKMHKGTLDIQSELNVGTCVTVRLPIDYVKAEPAIVDEAALEQAAESETETTFNHEQST
ncbi:MAG TPA: HAMP domain-containing sensor histidine kinase, partial [Clostridiales bacterium]|nr:HAMP domain-containing sensor histidine kinase [Clostridiales bacterium]